MGVSWAGTIACACFISPKAALCRSLCAWTSCVYFVVRSGCMRRSCCLYKEWSHTCPAMLTCKHPVRLHEEELHALKHEEAAGPASTLFMCVIDLVEPFFAVQVALHEEELRALKHEEASRASVLADLSSQRDRVALSIAQKLAKVGGGVKQAGPAPLPT
eukprot:scaffold86615_cov20-Tisochrysis_lutea.AAC.1